MFDDDCDEEEMEHIGLDEARSIMFCGCNSYDRLPTLIDISSQMNPEEWFSVLGEFWEVCDNTSYYLPDLCSQTPFLQLVRNPLAWRDHMMTTNERVALADLPECVTIYRGCYIHNMDGLSWSLDQQIAAGFPGMTHNRSKGPPLLIKATITRDQILAFKDGRREAKIIAWLPTIEAVDRLKKRR
ncbi:hypothetical protein [Sphingobium lactosutens]|uniref:Uncharacterized protein n=1 Tax=Sphingobium lactosutens DS20 TaxID=1331060 RepID=T0HGL5_9SPHN|nr:hypothetical protein [Sphingobium lactosutens]EQB12157.1 hypothetical protein RLDS_20610 [Sphingobium lactosutens DS20]